MTDTPSYHTYGMTAAAASGRKGRRWRRWHCLDCGLNTTQAGHYYMVRDEVWAASGVASFGGMLCLFCLEERLGRELVFADFTALVPRGWQEFVAFRSDPSAFTPGQDVLDL